MVTVEPEELSTMKMSCGGPELYELVIDGGVLKRWVGIGWMDEGEPTEEQWETLPQVININEEEDE